MSKLKTTLFFLSVALLTFFLLIRDSLLAKEIFKLGEEKFAYVGKERIQYFVEGTGKETIVLLHGLGGNDYDWRHLVNKLASQGYRVIFWNMRGVGQSDKPEKEEDYSIYKIADLFHGFMKSINLDKATIVGNSYGGGLAMIFAKEHSQMVEKLILINSLCYNQKPPFYLRFAAFSVIPKIAFAILPKYFLVKYTVRQMVYNKKLITDEDIKIYAQYIKIPKATDALIWTARQILKLKTDDQFFKEKIIKKIRVPTLIIWGDQDSIIPPSFAYQLNEDIKGSKLLMIENCGHVSQIEKPGEVSKAILEFIKD
ncbi:alpha/beta hydrolase [bacterium]|nr:alpha/beta hydrolase [bacterium]